MSNYWITIGGIFLFVKINLCLSQIERDIVLTPKQYLHRNGKILYFEPTIKATDLDNTTKAPWEHLLKHVTFLTLHNKFDERSQNISQLPIYKHFLNSTYIQSNDYIPKFGDIITLATGRLEKLPNNQYYFIEGKCGKRCLERKSKLIAFWTVQKIRHRDGDKNFRYELKFNIIPNVGEKDASKRETTDDNKLDYKSFTLKADDYPKNFEYIEKHIAQRRYDENPSIIPIEITNPLYHRNAFIKNEKTIKKHHVDRQLNIGEYIPEENHHISRVSDNVAHSTTFKPNHHHHRQQQQQHPKESSVIQQKYGLKFSDEFLLNNKSPQKLIMTPTAHHLHHHYYVMRNNFHNNINTADMNRQQIDLQHQFHTTSPISNQIPVPPDIVQADPYKITESNPIVPVSPLLYIPMMYQIYPTANQHQFDPRIAGYMESTNQPFIESPEIQNIRYSDPDPLYHKNGNYETNKINHPMVNTDEQNTFNEQIPSTAYLNPSIDNRNPSLAYVNPSTDSPIYHIDPSTSHVNPSTSIAQDHEEDSQGSETMKNQNQNSEIKNVQLPNPIISNDSESLSSSSSPSSLQSEILTSQSTQTTASAAFLVAPKTSTAPSTTSTTVNIEATINEPSTESINQKSNLKPTVITSSASPSTIKRNSYRSTTERPVLKWKPKRIKSSSSSSSSKTNHQFEVVSRFPANHRHKYEFEKIPVNSTEKVITVTPTQSNDNDISTKQSVSTSISIKVGNNIQQKKPFGLSEKIPLPNNFEVFKANLENIKTNSSNIKLYKATDDFELNSMPVKSNNKITNELSRTINDYHEVEEEKEIAKSIVQHVANLAQLHHSK